MSVKKKNQKKKQFGGVSIDLTTIPEVTNQETAFWYFLTNSKFELLSINSLNGVIFKVILNEGAISPYTSIRSDYFGDRINSIILKLLFVDGPDKLLLPKIRTENFPRTSSKSFFREVTTQTDIFKKSCLEENALQGLCPAILNYFLYDSVKHRDQLKAFLIFIGKRINHIYGTRQYSAVYFCLEQIYLLLKEHNYPNIKFGVISMEFAKTFVPLFQLTPPPDDESIFNLYGRDKYYLYEKYALFELERLHKLGYIHRDLHCNNIMIDPNGIYFENPPILNSLNSLRGRALIIDFGRTIPLSSNDCKFPPELDPNNLSNWSISDVIKMEIFNGTRPLGEYMSLTRPRDQFYSKIFPGMSVRIAYSWMEKYVINQEPNIILKNDPVFSSFSTKRNTMIQSFLYAIPPNYIEGLILLNDTITDATSFADTYSSRKPENSQLVSIKTDSKSPSKTATKKVTKSRSKSATKTVSKTRSKSATKTEKQKSQLGGIGVGVFKFPSSNTPIQIESKFSKKKFLELIQSTIRPPELKKKFLELIQSTIRPPELKEEFLELIQSTS